MHAGRAALDIALDRIGREIGQELRLDDEGRAVIELNALLDCDVVLDEATARIGFSTPLCMVAGDDAEHVCAAALKLTLGGVATGGATIALHPELRVLSLRLSIPAESSDSDVIERELRTFLATADTVRDVLAERSRGEAPSAPRSRESELMIRG